MASSHLFRLRAVATTALSYVLAAATASAGNVNFNFNASPGAGWTVENLGAVSGTSPTAWEWTAGPSSTEGGWHSRRGPESPLAATALVSPFFEVDDVGQHFVRVAMQHRYDFPTVTGSVLALGQVHFSINGGAWLGIRTADFTQMANHHWPTYTDPPGPLPAPLISKTQQPTGYPGDGWDVQAFAGTTPDFETGDHHATTITLPFPPDGTYAFGPGDYLRFRLVMAIQVPGTADDPPINWELNSLQVDGVSAVIVPEPDALALLGLGAAVGAVGLRRRSPPRS